MKNLQLHGPQIETNQTNTHSRTNADFIRLKLNSMCNYGAVCETGALLALRHQPLLVE